MLLRAKPAGSPANSLYLESTKFWSRGFFIARLNQFSAALTRITLETNETLINLQIEHAGGPHARYENWENLVRLVEVLYPEARYPGDLCRVIETLGINDTPLGALLLGNVSHPAGCLVWGRPLGLIEIEANPLKEQYVVAVSADDPYFAGVETLEQLPPTRLETLRLFLQMEREMAGAAIRWGSFEESLIVIRAARQKFRLAQAELAKLHSLEPAWKPARGVCSTGTQEAERYTRAEYTFHTLPYRFQKYVEEYLAPNERILFGLQRPVIRSAIQRAWLGRKRLQEGILLLSSQQVTQVVELMPPDRAGIFYGFIARGSVPERLEAAEVVRLSRDVVGLTLVLGASGGREEMIWEFPGDQETGVQAARDFLANWLPTTPGLDKRLRRATPPDPPETLPTLRDPAANHPEETRVLADRLQAARQASLRPCETILAHALLPAWIKGRGTASLFTVTTKRVLVTPDPEPADGARLTLNIPLHAISSLEFCSTLLVAYLKCFIPENGQITIQKISFGKTLAAMNDCFRVLRQAMAVIPVQQQELEHD